MMYVFPRQRGVEKHLHMSFLYWRWAPSYQCYLKLLMLLMLQVLSTRIVTRLRALIVLPTRDLVTQVRETFEAVGKGRGLKVIYILKYHDHCLSDHLC